jgi:arylformamidase
MKIHDISLTLSPELPVWPGDPAIHLQRAQSMDNGDMCNVTRMDISVHTGTHVDAPFHFINDEKTVESLDLNILNGPATVIEIPDEVAEITAEHLADLPDCERVLFKTRNSKHWAENNPAFDTHFVGLHESASVLLVTRGVKLVGIDALSVAPFDAPEPTHQILLGASIIIVEGLNFTDIEPGEWQFHCLPLKIAGSDGAPARAILCR